MYKSIKVIILLAIANQSISQNALENYIREAINNNTGLKQQTINLNKSVLALKEAKTLFFPSMSIQGNYFLADGGRTIDLPLGDLLNPAYSTLNQLTQSNNFPQFENQSILLNPNNFYDLKMRTTAPLINLEIEFNRRIKSNLVNIQKLEVEIFKRELVKETKLAYYQYLKAADAERIYQNALVLVSENKRINESLFINQTTNRTALKRSEAEVVKINAELQNASQIKKNAKAYFNFILNKNLSDSIIEDLTIMEFKANEIGLSIDSREELKQLNLAQSVNKEIINLNKATVLPNLSAFLDLGSQAFDWEFNDKSRYYFFGLSFQWNIFSFGKNYYKIKQAKEDLKNAELKTEDVTDKLQLQMFSIANEYSSALSKHIASKSVLNAAQTNYTDALKLYKEGIIIYLELLDAQNQLINAQLQVSISSENVLSKMAEIERINATFKFNN